MIEVLANIRSLVRELTPEVRRDIVDTLRKTPTDTDNRREPKIEWRIGIYFHALQDTLLATQLTLPSDLEIIRSIQACFVKDLDDYIGRFPGTEDQGMKQLFQSIFEVGTSVFWDQDREFTLGFDRAILGIK